jgi:hypothetical protein
MIEFAAGDRFMMQERGEPVGPFIVVSTTGGRTPEHLVARNPRNGVLFEVHRDAAEPEMIALFDVTCEDCDLTLVEDLTREEAVELAAWHTTDLDHDARICRVSG